MSSSITDPMDPSDLTPMARKAYDALTDEEDKLAFLKEQSQLKNSLIRASLSQVAARNNSHNLGKSLKQEKSGRDSLGENE